MSNDQEVVFYKMQGCGNDFILIDNRTLQYPVEKMEKLAQKLCQRCFSIGADGLIFLDHAPNNNHDYRWHFYNSDGSRSDMCGNGARCAAWLSVYLGLAETKHQFLTDVGTIEATVYSEKNRAEISFVQVKNLKTHFAHYLDYTLHCVNTGVPHVVIITDSVESIDMNTVGRQIRFHSLFAPEGTNVNFVQVVNPQYILIRTYERGIEKEPFACGTGAVAAAVITTTLGLTQNNVELMTLGKEVLHVTFKQYQAWLEGPARLIYTGKFNLKE